MRISALLAASACIAGLGVTPLYAQDVSQREDAQKTGEIAQQQSDVPTEAPIIVTGEPDDQPEVVLGSRIARRPFFKFQGIATNTGTRGLVPQSGMDQGANVRTIRKTECASDDPRIGRKAACLLIDADAAYGAGKVADAQDTLAYLTFTEEFSPYERLQGAKRQYKIAEDQGNDASREVALEQMVETGGMEQAEELRARKALISMALKSGNRQLARERLLELDGKVGLDAQRMANLAILTREQYAGDHIAIMRRAIALRREKGLRVPKSWHDFTGAKTNATGTP